MSNSHPIKDQLVLVVEDDLVNISVLSMTLRQLGAQILFERYAENVMKTLEIAHPRIPDLVLLDYHLPAKKTGFDVYKALQEHEEYCNIPVVIVTAADPDPLLPQARKMGLNGLITKPIRSTSFAKKLEAVLQGQDVWLEIDF